MGIYCAKLCFPELPNPRRNVRAATAQVVRLPRASRRDRLDALWDESASVIFKEGFHLGMKVRKLQVLLESADSGDDRGLKRASDFVAEEPEAVQLRVNEQSVPVKVDTAVPVIVEDDPLQVARKLVPHSLVDVIKHDFKPWLRVVSGSRASLP